MNAPSEVHREMRPVATGPGVVAMLLGGLGLFTLPRTGPVGVLVMAVAAAVLVVDALFAPRPITRLTVTATTPRDAVAGAVTPVTLRFEGGTADVQFRLLDPSEEWFAAGVPAVVDIAHRAARRGTFPTLRLEVRANGPLGVAAAVATITVMLPRAVDVAPPPSPVTELPPETVSAISDVSPFVDEIAIRGLREYIPGDAPRQVHWPTTARVGRPMVREPERQRTVVAIGCDLNGHDPERAARAAMGAAVFALGRGHEVVLCTNDWYAGPTAAPVATPLEAGRRLARALPGVVPDARGDVVVVAR